MTAAPGDECRVELSGRHLLAKAPAGARQGNAVAVGIRPEHLVHAGDAPSDVSGLVVGGTVVQHVYLGDVTQVYVAIQGGERCMLTVSKGEADRRFAVGSTVSLYASRTIAGFFRCKATMRWRPAVQPTGPPQAR